MRFLVIFIFYNTARKKMFIIAPTIAAIIAATAEIVIVDNGSPELLGVFNKC
jgi:hypothetical protein